MVHNLVGFNLSGVRLGLSENGVDHTNYTSAEIRANKEIREGIVSFIVVYCPFTFTFLHPNSECTPSTYIVHMYIHNKGL
jgi:hypothetical protein